MHTVEMKETSIEGNKTSGVIGTKSIVGAGAKLLAMESAQQILDDVWGPVTPSMCLAMAGSMAIFVASKSSTECAGEL